MEKTSFVYFVEEKLLNLFSKYICELSEVKRTVILFVLYLSESQTACHSVEKSLKIQCFIIGTQKKTPEGKEWINRKFLQSLTQKCLLHTNISSFVHCFTFLKKRFNPSLRPFNKSFETTKTLFLVYNL